MAVTILNLRTAPFHLLLLTQWHKSTFLRSRYFLILIFHSCHQNYQYSLCNLWQQCWFMCFCWHPLYVPVYVFTCVYVHMYADAHMRTCVYLYFSTGDHGLGGRAVAATTDMFSREEMEHDLWLCKAVYKISIGRVIHSHDFLCVCPWHL